MIPTSVSTVIMPGYDHAHAFHEIAEAFDAAMRADPMFFGNGSTLRFGCHLISMHDNYVQMYKDDVIYQSEQITPECPWLKTPYLNLLRAHEVWDYSQANVDALKKYGVQAKLVPVRYMPCMTKPNNFPKIENDIDVLFYGSTNPHRIDILNNCIRAGLKVHKLFGVYGAERDKWIARSRIVLNLHYYDDGIFEIFRCAHLFANSVCVVSEIGRDKELDDRHDKSCVFVDAKRIPEICNMLCEEWSQRQAIEEIGFANFSQIMLSDELRKAVA